MLLLLFLQGRPVAAHAAAHAAAHTAAHITAHIAPHVAAHIAVARTALMRNILEHAKTCEIKRKHANACGATRERGRNIDR
jgi:hypothetical protein